MWFTGCEPIVRAVLFSGVAYVALIALVRFLGHRTISNMNQGDFVVTVALGSVVASLIIPDVLPSFPPPVASCEART